MLDEFLVRDIHPAEVLLPDGKLLTRCRVFVTSKRVQVWRENLQRMPFLEVEITLADPDSVVESKATMMRNDRLEIVGLHGHAYINKGRGCDCGSSLKALSAPASWKGK